MAVMTQQGPQTTDPTREAHRGQGRKTDLSELSVSDPFSEQKSPLRPSHTRDSVAQRWANRSFDTGAAIKGEVLGGKR